MGKHTPGPWVLSSAFLVCTRQAQVVANCSPSGIPTLDVPAAQTVANARLIAHAPELLEALLALRATCLAAINSGDWKVDGACDPDMDFKRANAAIAKATP